MGGIRIIGWKEAQETVLRRRPLEEAVAPPQVRERIREVFGEDLSPAQVVERIVGDVRARGDAALREWTLKLDGVELDGFEVGQAEVRRAYDAVPPGLAEALRTAAGRIRAFHEKQARRSWIEFAGDSALGQLVRPLGNVGIYAPGGRAAYPSTVLMATIPARVAGVERIVLATPPAKDGALAPAVLAAADIAGVDRIFRIGGAQAIAALAYGTESVPQVDKIVGPGNIFVALAKRLVFGAVAIDQLAGPTETLIIADGSADPTLAAADLLAQAEHDPLATALLLTDSIRLAKAVQGEVERQLAVLERRDIAAEALARHGAVVVAESLTQALDLANGYAPEHLCLLTADPWSLVGQVRHAGAVFLSPHSPEAMGDYVAGPSHVLPTGGTARFSSPLSVDDFLKTISLVALGPQDMAQLGPAAQAIAQAEGLTAHARAVEMRLKQGLSSGPSEAAGR